MKQIEHLAQFDLRHAAVDLVLREALRTGKSCRLEDRISVDRALLRHAAWTAG